LSGEKSGAARENGAQPGDQPSSRFRFLRRPLFLFLVCVLCAVLIKLFVVKGFTVPTDSMEPLLHGDREMGDKVAVFQLHYDLFGPERFDVVVFSLDRNQAGEKERLAGDGQRIDVVKRIAGLPGEKFSIRDGDIWVGEKEPELFRKSLDEIEELLIPVYRADFDKNFFTEWNAYSIEKGERKGVEPARRGLMEIEDEALVLSASRPGVQGRDLSLSYSVTEIADLYLDENNEPHGGVFPGIRDICLTLECEIMEPGRGAVTGSLLEGVDLFRFELLTRDSGGGGRLTHEVRNTEVESRAITDFPGLEPGESCLIRFMNVDNQVLLLCDEKLICRYEYENNADPNEISNNPAFGASGVKALFRRVEIDRDIHYLSRGEYGVPSPFSIPENCYFLLGDNSSESHDSRHYGAVRREDIVGKPFLIFSPLPRFRFL